MRTLPIRLQGPTLKPVLTVNGVVVWTAEPDDLISSTRLKDKVEYLEPRSKVFTRGFRPYTIVEAQDHSWGKGKAHLAGFDQYVLCGTTLRKTPNRQVQNYLDHVTCKRCLSKLELNRRSCYGPRLEFE